MPILRSVWRTSLVALAVAGVAHAKPALNAAGLDRLAHYEVLSFSDPAGGGINKGKAIGVFDATPDEIYRVVTDYERYPEYAPRVVQARVVDRQKDDRAFVELRTDLPWPVSDAWVFAEFDHDKLPGGVFRVRFGQLRGSMRRYFGSILIEPWSKWKSSVTYELVAEPDSSAPKSLINARIEQSAAKWIHFLRQRINELHRLGLLHPQAPPNPNLVSPLAGPRQPVQVENVATNR